MPVSEEEGAGTTFLAHRVPLQGLIDVSNDWVVTSCQRAGSVRHLTLPNDHGQWMPRRMVLTPYCIFTFLEEDAEEERWTRPQCAIPLQYAELESKTELVPCGVADVRDRGVHTNRFAIWFALGYLVVAVDEAGDRAAWLDAITAAIKACQ